jgi:hypothetical protein
LSTAAKVSPGDTGGAGSARETLSPTGGARLGVIPRNRRKIMGRTATAFLVLVAMGGCVADYDGPPAAFQTVQRSQPPAASCYATWNKSDQFAILHDGVAVVPPPMAAQAVTPPPVVRVAAAGALKPLPAPKPFSPALASEGLPLLGGSAPVPATVPTDTTIDPELAQATMVQAPVDRSEVVEPRNGKVQPKTLQAKKTDSEMEPASTNAALPPPRPKKMDPELEQASASAASPPIRMVNTKRVTLNYELKDMDNSGISGVELWRTRDAHTWERGEIVGQTNHSFSVEVKDEGLHGFTLLARNGVDAGKEAPVAGEQPQVWVMADFTKPVVQIIGVEVAHNGKSPTIQIHWTAKDKNLGFKPITLSYAEQSQGPWLKLAAGVENNGQFEWQAPPTAPHHIFLRVEAADLAGNIASVQTPNALRLDTVVALPASASTSIPASEFMHKAVTTVPPTPPTPHPTAAILGVEPNGN